MQYFPVQVPPAWMQHCAGVEHLHAATLPFITLEQSDGNSVEHARYEYEPVPGDSVKVGMAPAGAVSTFW